MSYTEMAEWLAFSRLYPFGEIAKDVRSAMVATLIAQTSQTGKRRKKYKLKDFLPFKRDHLPLETTREGLVSRVMKTFKGLGMKTKEGKDA